MGRLKNIFFDQAGVSKHRNRTMQQKQQSKLNQQGAVLIVGLIMLLLMTIVGMAAIRGTDLQELMAGNARNKQIAFQAAETALRQAELVIDGPTPPNTGTQVGMIVEQSEGLVASYWRDTYQWTASGTPKSVEVNDALKFVQAKPRYVVEEIQVREVPGLEGGSIDDIAIKFKTFYRITSRGVGLTDNSIVYLQVLYRRDL
jgi:type IV pilus assembly protein PilX